jgi:hypothetical protein
MVPEVLYGEMVFELIAACKEGSIHVYILMGDQSQ